MAHYAAGQQSNLQAKTLQSKMGHLSTLHEVSVQQGAIFQGLCCEEAEGRAYLQFVFFGIPAKFRYRASPENVSRLAPPNLLGLAPPKFSKCWNHIHFARHLYIFQSLGGASLGL